MSYAFFAIVAIFNMHRSTDHVEWKFNDARCNLGGSLARHIDGILSVVLIRQTEYEMYQLEIVHEIGKNPIRLQLHAWTQILDAKGVLYYPEYRLREAGCKLHALDLATGNDLWATDLKAMGVVNHNKYTNKVNIELTDADVIVYGWEMMGKYIEIVDRKTGKQKSHTIVGK